MVFISIKGNWLFTCKAPNAIVHLQSVFDIPHILYGTLDSNHYVVGDYLHNICRKRHIYVLVLQKEFFLILTVRNLFSKEKTKF